ncbi:MAG: TRAP transporter small permease subunit [Thiobacillus sp.]|nr:TRAP transporter small permease subunit [Thiobacillus sp.]
MDFLLKISRGIDALNERVGRLVIWLVLAATLISAGNAMVRYGLNASSNAWLEIQWYLFGLIFLLGAGYTLKHNGHVRIDVLYGRFTPRTRAWVDLLGGLLFLLPMSGIIAWLGWDFFLASYAVDETSPDAGGLLRWPIKLAVPLGFSLLWLQGVSEVIKRAGVLWGGMPLQEEHGEEVA